MNMNCSHCGNDKFHVDLNKQILSCTRCRYYYDFSDLIEVPGVPQTEYLHCAFDPQRFEISNGVLLKYKGHDRAVMVPDGVNAIYRGAFRGDYKVRSVLLPEGVQRIEAHAFAECRELTYVRLPNTLREIGEEAFSGCVNLVEITLPRNLWMIGGGAFYNCKSLVRLTIPDSVRILEDGQGWRTTFRGCESLEEIHYPEKRFGIEKFRGSLYYRRHPEGQRRMISAGICPECDGKLGLFRRCKSCGRRW